MRFYNSRKTIDNLNALYERFRLNRSFRPDSPQNDAQNLGEMLSLIAKLPELTLELCHFSTTLYREKLAPNIYNHAASTAVMTSCIRFNYMRHVETFHSDALRRARCHPRSKELSPLMKKQLAGLDLMLLELFSYWPKRLGQLRERTEISVKEAQDTKDAARLHEAKTALSHYFVGLTASGCHTELEASLQQHKESFAPRDPLLLRSLCRHYISIGGVPDLVKAYMGFSRRKQAPSKQDHFLKLEETLRVLWYLLFGRRSCALLLNPPTPMAGIDFSPQHDWVPLETEAYEVLRHFCKIRGREGTGIDMIWTLFVGYHIQRGELEQARKVLSLMPKTAKKSDRVEPLCQLAVGLTDSEQYREAAAVIRSLPDSLPYRKSLLSKIDKLMTEGSLRPKDFKVSVPQPGIRVLAKMWGCWNMKFDRVVTPRARVLRERGDKEPPYAETEFFIEPHLD